MYIPDRVYEKRLKDYDPTLEVKWVHKDPRGRLIDRWAIFRKTPSANKLYNRWWLVMYVKNIDGSYRPLDSRTLTEIRKADTQNRAVDDILNEGIERQERTEELANASWRSEIKDISKDVQKDIASTVDDDFPELGSENRPKEDVFEENFGNLTEEEMDVWA